MVLLRTRSRSRLPSFSPRPSVPPHSHPWSCSHPRRIGLPWVPSSLSSLLALGLCTHWSLSLWNARLPSRHFPFLFTKSVVGFNVLNIALLRGALPDLQTRWASSLWHIILLPCTALHNCTQITISVWILSNVCLPCWTINLWEWGTWLTIAFWYMFVNDYVMTRHRELCRLQRPKNNS